MGRKLRGKDGLNSWVKNSKENWVDKFVGKWVKKCNENLLWTNWVHKLCDKNGWKNCVEKLCEKLV